MINRTGERYRCCTDDNYSDHKFITNYLTSDIIKLLKLDLEIFTIDGLVSVANVIIDNQDIAYTDIAIYKYCLNFNTVNHKP